MASDPSGVTLRSPALYLGEVHVPPHRHRRRRLLRTPTLKKHLTRHLYWLLRRLPPGATQAYLQLLFEAVQGLRVLPGWALTTACRDVALLAAARAGIVHDPRKLRRRFVDAIHFVFDQAIRLHHEGPEAVLGAVRVLPGTRESLAWMLRERGAGMIAVPHNPGAVLASMNLSREAPVVLISKNSPSPERTRIALDFYERMGVKVLMVRGGNPYEVSRACLRALKDGNVLVATLDSISREKNRAVVEFLGEPVGFPTWAARIAAHARVPICPAWVGFDGRRLTIELGEGEIATETEAAVRRYAAWFESRVLRDPASWSFLADRRWRRVLEAAAGRARREGRVA
jgi:hypothetical protein